MDELHDEIYTEDILEQAIEAIECWPTKRPHKYYYVLGCMGQKAAGISNKTVINYFKDYSDIILIDGKGRKYCRGRRLRERKKSFWKNIWSKIKRC